MEPGVIFWGLIYLLTILAFPYLAWLAWVSDQKKKQGLWPKEDPDFVSYWEEKGVSEQQRAA